MHIKYFGKGIPQNFSEQRIVFIKDIPLFINFDILKIVVIKYF